MIIEPLEVTDVAVISGHVMSEKINEIIGYINRVEETTTDAAPGPEPKRWLRPRTDRTRGFNGIACEVGDEGDDKWVQAHLFLVDSGDAYTYKVIINDIIDRFMCCRIPYTSDYDTEQFEEYTE